MNTLYGFILAVTLGAGASQLTEADLMDVYGKAMESLRSTQSSNDSQLLKAGTIAWQLDNNTTAEPSPQQLVEAGYLDPKFLTREQL